MTINEQNKPFFTAGWSAAAWCSKENAHKEMDVVLAQEIERIANAKVAPLLEESKKLRLKNQRLREECEFLRAQVQSMKEEALRAIERLVGE